MERELWLQLYALVVQLDSCLPRGFYRSSEIVAVFLWAVVHDRPTSWACDARNWQGKPPDRLPPQCTMSRRLRSLSVLQLLKKVEVTLGEDSRQWWVHRIDSKPLPIGPHTKDPDARYRRPRGYEPQIAFCLTS